MTRIFGSNPNASVEAKKFNASTTSCSVAYWTTDTISNTSLPISLRTVISHKKLFNDSLDATKKRLLVLVEVWHKQKADTNDKLITRYVETKNVTLESNSVEESEWHYSGRNNKRNNSTNVQFLFRWRISPTFVDYLNSTLEHKCPSGWKGDNCEQPICMESCHQSHGWQLIELYCEDHLTNWFVLVADTASSRASASASSAGRVWTAIIAWPFLDVLMASALSHWSAGAKRVGLECSALSVSLMLLFWMQVLYMLFFYFKAKCKEGCDTKNGKINVWSFSLNYFS